MGTLVMEFTEEEHEKFKNGEIAKCDGKVKSEGYRAIQGCGEVKDDLGNRVCWRKRLCKDCIALRVKASDAVVLLDETGGKE